MDNRDRTITDMNAELERLRRRIVELESGAAPRIFDEGYRLLFENNPLPLWVYDLKTLSFLAVNNAAVRKYGYSREEFLGMTIADIRPSEDIPRLMENIACVTCGLDEAGFWRHRKKDGTIIDVEIVSHTLIFEGREAELVLASDITGRRQAEEALNAAKEYAESLIETANTIVVGINLMGNITVFNRAAEAITGYSRSELTDRNWFEVLVPKERYPHVWTEFERLMTGGMPEHFENPILTKSGEERTIAWQNNQVYEQGKISGTISFGIDITERKRMEESLYLKNYVFDVSITANSIVDINGVITQVNQAFLAIWGYSSEGQVIGRQIPEFLQNADEAAAIIAVLNTAGKWEGNYTARKKDGSTFAAFGLATTLKDKQGNTIGYQSSVLDVTDHRNAEVALRESEERYRTMVETTTEWIWQIDLAGTHTFSNQGVTAILGYHPDEFVGKNAMAFMHEDDRREVESALPRLIADKQGWREWVLRWRHKDGTYRYLESNASPVINEAGEFIGYLGADRDITERKQAEKSLRESEERLRLALSAAKQGLYDLNVQTGEAIVSPEYAQMLGYAPEEFIETNAKWIERLHPDDQAPVAEIYRAYIKGALPEYRVEFRQRTESGEWKWILSIGKIVEYDTAGNPLRMLGTHTDITDRKKAERERLDLERRLLHAQKLESLGVLAGGIAHDFNNLLMAILGNLDMALIKLPAGSPAAVNIEQSAQAARRASDLTRQMLAYSGKGRFLVEQTDLNALIEENIKLFRVAIAKTTTISLHLSRPLPLIEADKGQIQQVIMNLLTNASEAIGDKPGVISLSTGMEDSDAQYLAQSRTAVIPPAGRFVYLEVSDTGSGMDEQTQQRLFDPFFTTKTMGRGLGMSSILGIVGGHQGAVFVDSAEGRGTAIRIFFPAPAETQPKKETSAPETDQETGMSRLSGKILVVDDEEMVRNICRQMVEALGYQVLTAVDGRDAVEVFTKHLDDIALVILDLSMPNMDGITAYNELARIKPGVKVILCSGFDQQDSLQRYSGKWLAGFMQKPYSIDNLRAAMETAVRSGG